MRQDSPTLRRLPRTRFSRSRPIKDAHRCDRKPGSHTRRAHPSSPRTNHRMPTARLPARFESRLDSLTSATSRTRVFLVREAIFRHVDDSGDVLLMGSHPREMRPRHPVGSASRPDGQSWHNGLRWILPQSGSATNAKGIRTAQHQCSTALSYCAELLRSEGRRATVLLACPKGLRPGRHDASDLRGGLRFCRRAVRPRAMPPKQE